ncbi:MAG: hypothetical protein OEZ08_00485 [Betaproteobacteria bacterium]|nr:hypothetical protein [Betaproteobacteria bacterium]
MNRLIALLAGTLVLAPAPSLSQSEWVDIKDPSELRALYSNKTFKETDYLDRPFVGHYRDDGHGTLLFQGDTYPRTWAVSGNDQVCVTWAMGTMCYQFQKHKNEPGRYRNWQAGNDRMINNFRVEDGIPKF